MKTKQGWDNSNLNFTQYVESLDEIDEELFDYLLGVVYPQYQKYNLLQSGEVYIHIDGVPNFMTAVIKDNKYYYLGILPEFKK